MAHCRGGSGSVAPGDSALRDWEEATHRPPTPVVALSANAMDEDVQRSLAAGANAHIAKPVKKTALLAAISTYARPQFTAQAA